MGTRASVSSKKGEHRNFDDLHDALAGAILKMWLLDWLDFVVLDIDDPVKVLYNACVHAWIPLMKFCVTNGHI